MGPPYYVIAVPLSINTDFQKVTILLVLIIVANFSTEKKEIIHETVG